MPGEGATGGLDRSPHRYGADRRLRRFHYVEPRFYRLLRLVFAALRTSRRVTSPGQMPMIERYEGPASPDLSEVEVNWCREIISL